MLGDVPLVDQIAGGDIPEGPPPGPLHDPNAAPEAAHPAPPQPLLGHPAHAEALQPPAVNAQPGGADALHPVAIEGGGMFPHNPSADNVHQAAAQLNNPDLQGKQTPCPPQPP
jgi:hypothetical protein